MSNQTPHETSRPRPGFTSTVPPRRAGEATRRLLTLLAPLAIVASGILLARAFAGAPRLLPPLAVAVLALCATVLLATFLVRIGAPTAPLRAEDLSRRIRALERRPRRADVRLLLDQLCRRPHLLYELLPTDRAAVVRAIHATRATDDLQTMVAARRNPLRRIGGAHLIAWLRAPNGVSRLIGLLSDPHPQVAFAAADALSRLDDARGNEALVLQIGRKGLPASRIAALLERLPAERLAAVLTAHAGDPDPQRRFWIAYLAGTAHAQESLPLLLALSGDGDANVRASAAEALGAYPAPAVRRRLQTLLHDNAWFVQSHAAKALALLGPDDESTLDLASLLTSPVWWVRHHAARALRHGGQRVDTALIRLLHGESEVARRHAAAVLVQRGMALRCATALQGPAERASWASDQVRALVDAGAASALPLPVLEAVEPQPVYRPRIAPTPLAN